MNPFEILFSKCRLMPEVISLRLGNSFFPEVGTLGKPNFCVVPKIPEGDPLDAF